MTVYLDTSVLVWLFVAHDDFAARAQALTETSGFTPVVSDFVSTEFASVIARLTRMNSLHLDGAREIFAEFDAWAASCADLAEVAGIDVQTAEGFIRRLDLNIRAPDAINPGYRKPARRTDRHLRSRHGRLRDDIGDSTSAVVNRKNATPRGPYVPIQSRPAYPRTGK